MCLWIVDLEGFGVMEWALALLHGFLVERGWQGKAGLTMHTEDFSLKVFEA